MSQPRFTVIELATGVDHGTYETLAELAAALAFAKLGPDDVEIFSDIFPLSATVSW